MFAAPRTPGGDASPAPASPVPGSPGSAAASKRSWISSWTTADPEELRRRAEKKERIRAAAAAQRVERAALVARRDVLAYFDTLRRLGPFIYLDTVPAVMNAMLTVTVGTLALFMDGGGSLSDTGGACGLTLHFFVLCLIGAAYALLGLMSYVIMGYRVTIDIGLPFQALVAVLCGQGAVWFFFGLPVFYVWVLQSSAAGGNLPCLQQQPLLFGARWGCAPARSL